MIVTGRLVGSEGGRVRYTYETASSNGPMGSISIAMDDPTDWIIEGDAVPTSMAVAVWEKARKGHEQTGTWPTRVSRFS